MPEGVGGGGGGKCLRRGTLLYEFVNDKKCAHAACVCVVCVLVVVHLPWRQRTPSAYAAAAGVFLLAVAAGVRVPSLRRVAAFSPGTSMSAPLRSSPALLSRRLCRRARSGGQKQRRRGDPCVTERAQVI